MLDEWINEVYEELDELFHKIQDKQMIQKIIQELRKIDQIRKPVLRLKEVEDLIDKTFPELIKKEKQEIIKKVQQESK